MQQNSAEIYSKLSRSSENVATQQTSTNPAQFIRVPKHPKFTVTPESMGMNLCSDLPTTTREQQQQRQPQHDPPPLVEVKSYCERHNSSSVRMQPDINRASNVSFYSSHSNTPTSSHASIRTDIIDEQIKGFPEFMTQKGPSPNSSPKTPSHPWNFGTSMNNNESAQQLNLRYSPGYNNNNNNNHEPTLCDQLSLNENAAAHSQSAYLQNIIALSEMSIYSDQEMQKYRSGSDVCEEDTARLNLNQLNDLYAKRIEYIDENAWGDKDLKIFTYKEWIKILTNINESFIKNMSDLEKEITGRLQLMQGRVSSNCRYSQGQELMKCRKDFEMLLQYIKNSPNFKKSDLQSLQFETISPDQLLDVGEWENLTIDDMGGDDIKNYNDADAVQKKNKLYANMKALAHEVADKHDEVRELKRQVICLEDEIQKAQKKIQLKDDVIKELRNDLKAANNKISSNPSPEPSLVMPPINCDNETSSTVNTDIRPTSQIDNGSQFDSLSQTEREEQKKIKLLNEEINDLLAMNKDLNKHTIEYHHLRINDVMQKLESEKDDAYHKLNFIRRQLIDLESDSTDGGNNDCDSGFHSKCDNNPDAKILDAIRKRLRALNDMNCELKKGIRKLELENKELVNNLQTDKSFYERNGTILKQLADLLCDMKCKQFSYTEIYNSDSSQVNPFCEAIIEMQRDFQEKENQLIKALGMQKQQNEELSQRLLENEKSFNEERTIRLNLENCEDIDKTTAPQLQTSSQPQSVVISSFCTAPSQSPSTSSTSLTGQQLDSKSVVSLHRFLDK